MRQDRRLELMQVALDTLTHALEVGQNELPSPQALRQASQALRSLLLPGRGDDILRRAAKQRKCNDIFFPTRDYSLAVQYLRDGRITFFQRAGAALWGLEYEGVTIGPTEATQDVNFHAGSGTEVNQDLFLNEIVLGFNKNVVSRKKVIEYLANKAGGIHLADERRGAYAVLDQIREVILVRQTPTGIAFEIHADRYFRPTDLFRIKGGRIDPISIEVLATCCWMAKSKSLHDFRAGLQREIEAAAHVKGFSASTGR